MATAAEQMGELGARLRRQRLQRNWPQSELAAMAGVALGTLRAIEGGGNASLENWLRVVQALGLAEDLQGLFAREPQSIAQMAQAAQVAQQQRARRPRRPKP